MAKKKIRAPFEWKAWTFKTGELRSWRMGPLQLWAALQDREWKLAWKRGENVETKRGSTPLPPGAAWERWVAPESSNGLRFSPALADLPLVAQPVVPFRILPSESARIYVNTPVSVRVSLADDSDRTLLEIHTERLSKTWNGSMTRGTVAYWTRTHVRRNHEPSTIEEHFVTSPIMLANDSKEALRVQKIHVRLPHLSVYAGKGALWTDASRIVFKGTEESQTIREEGEPPPECPGALLLTGPRATPKSGLASLSSSPLKAITELGF
ncbi:MAG: DUF432 domain-containing protein [Planctomycetota bacterium]|jgi:hypothetical protein